VNSSQGGGSKDTWVLRAGNGDDRVAQMAAAAMKALVEKKAAKE
jgi:uncharacterized circularly permuted ATP-grasp superfamily protein